MYYRTYDTDQGMLAADGGPTTLADPATVSSFRLDKYDVTVGRFRQFVAAWNDGNGWLPTAGSGKHTHLNGGLGLVNSAPGGGYEPGWVESDDGNTSPTNANLESCMNPHTPALGSSPSFSTWTDSPAFQENLPINCVSWQEAYAFCIWDGGFLPSEAEWEYAAAGGNQQREYPWGSAAPGTANQFAIYGDGLGNCYYPTGALAVCTGVANIAPVGTAASGAGLFGQLDLAGNMWQWNLDWWDTYATCTDCAYLTQVSSRVARGGDFENPAGVLFPTVRHNFYAAPANRGSNIGFRCARTP
jgi:formylglycine-generating enzyme required for sulfatase activity